MTINDIEKFIFRLTKGDSRKWLKINRRRHHDLNPRFLINGIEINWSDVFADPDCLDCKGIGRIIVEFKRERNPNKGQPDSDIINCSCTFLSRVSSETRTIRLKPVEGP